MSTELAVVDRAIPATAQEIRAQVNLIQEVMRAVMKDGTHYGKIPGTDKPSLLKPGSEKILSTFRIAVEPQVEDLSTGDEARYRVLARGVAQHSGALLGVGVGEASSHEEKYKWRAAVCQEEYDETPEDRRRRVWKKGRGGDKPYTILQVRTNHADIANTVLKMAKKRAQIDMTLTVTAASDVFAQDIEDLPEEIRDVVAAEGHVEAPKPAMEAPQRKAEPSKPAPTAAGEPVISEPQARRLYAIAKGAGWGDDDLRHFLLDGYGVDDSRKLPRRLYEQACARLEQGA